MSAHRFSKLFFVCLFMLSIAQRGFALGNVGGPLPCEWGRPGSFLHKNSVTGPQAPLRLRGGWLKDILCCLCLHSDDRNDGEVSFCCYLPFRKSMNIRRGIHAETNKCMLASVASKRQHFPCCCLCAAPQTALCCECGKKKAMHSSCSIHTVILSQKQQSTCMTTCKHSQLAAMPHTSSFDPSKSFRRASLMHDCIFFLLRELYHGMIGSN